MVLEGVLFFEDSEEEVMTPLMIFRGNLEDQGYDIVRFHGQTHIGIGGATRESLPEDAVRELVKKHFDGILWRRHDASYGPDGLMLSLPPVRMNTTGHLKSVKNCIDWPPPGDKITHYFPDYDRPENFVREALEVIAKST